MLEAERGQRGGIVKVQLAHEVGAVFFNGFHADVEEVGNFLVLVAFPQQFQNLFLALLFRVFRPSR
jgi:hypothetical protein